MEERKGKKSYIVIIIILLLAVIGLSSYIVYDKVIKKDESKENQKEDKKETYTITEEEAKALLDNYIPDTGDEYLEYHIFYNTVSYLVKHDKYTKDGTAFVFKESDIKDFIQTYFNRDNFDYQSEGMVVTRDSSNQTVKVEVNFALFGEGEGGVEDTIGYKDYKTIKNFTFENGVADFIYSKKIVYNEPFEIDGKITSETNWNYKVKLIKVNGKLRVKESLMLYN